MKINKTNFLNSYGRDTILKIRRKDKKIVTLDFKKPELLRNPDRFYSTTRNPDPLQKKTEKYQPSALWVCHVRTVIPRIRLKCIT
jgi:hypothetical protein